jgi:Domain of unknown function (DUF6438)
MVPSLVEDPREAYWTPSPGFLASVVVAALAVLSAGILVLTAAPNFGEYGPHHPFPALRDPTSLVITLEHSSCFWNCPAYRVALHGDGSVVYQGGRCTALRGEHRFVLAPAVAATLLDRFRALDFFSLRDAYTANLADAQTRRLSIAFDGQAKSVVDRGGEAMGLPAGVGALQRAIDQATGARDMAYGPGPAKLRCP